MNALPTIGGAAGGGALAAWFFRLTITRALNENDKKHAEHARRLERLTEKFGESLSELKTKLAVLEVTVADAKNLRSDIKDLQGRAAILEAHLSKAHQRIDSLKSDFKELKSVVSGIDPLV